RRGLVDEAAEHVARVLKRDVELGRLPGNEARGRVAGAAVARRHVDLDVGAWKILGDELIAGKLQLSLHSARAAAEERNAPALLARDDHGKAVHPRRRSDPSSQGRGG